MTTPAIAIIIAPPVPIIRRPRVAMPATLILPLVKCGVRYTITSNGAQ